MYSWELGRGWRSSFAPALLSVAESRDCLQVFDLSKGEQGAALDDLDAFFCVGREAVEREGASL